VPAPASIPRKNLPVLLLQLPTAADAADLVDALLLSDPVHHDDDPQRATRHRALAHTIGDGLDRLPRPTTSKNGPA
jgi:hypothetical protein